jgi:hypothetical protein
MSRWPLAFAVLFALGCSESPVGSVGVAVRPPPCSTNADCNDGIYCDGVESCVNGACRNGTPVSCGDAFTCTYDVCDESIVACRHLPDHTQCAAGTLCSPTSGCQAAPRCTSDADCDDHLICNGAEHCTAGVCTGSPPLNCDDGIDCTSDFCAENRGCVHIPVDLSCGWGMRCRADTGCAPLPRCSTSADCNDNVYCNGVESCQNGACYAGARPDVSDGVACTVDLCDEVTFSAVHISDDSLCAVGQQCRGAAGCVGSGRGCSSDADCDDNVFCNGSEACTGGVCVPGTRPSCDDGDRATVDICDETRRSCLHYRTFCPPNGTNDFYVNTTADRSMLAALPTGVNFPPECAFPTLSEGLYAAGRASGASRVIADGATPSAPIVFIHENYPLVVPNGAVVTTKDDPDVGGSGLDPSHYVLAYDDTGSSTTAMLLGSNVQVRGFTIRNARTRGGDAIRCSTDGVRVDSLLLDGTASGGAPLANGVHVVGNCNAQTSSIVARNFGNAGVFVEAGQADLTGGQLIGNGTGLSVTSAGNPFYPGDGSVYNVGLHAVGLEISSSTLDGVFVDATSTVTLLGVKIHDNGRHGVHVVRSTVHLGLGEFDNYEPTSLFGVTIREDAHLGQSKIHHNGGVGVLFGGCGLGVCSANDQTGDIWAAVLNSVVALNTGNGIEVDGATNQITTTGMAQGLGGGFRTATQVFGNQILHNLGTGLLVHEAYLRPRSSGAGSTGNAIGGNAWSPVSSDQCTGAATDVQVRFDGPVPIPEGPLAVNSGPSSDPPAGPCGDDVTPGDTHGTQQKCMDDVKHTSAGYIKLHNCAWNNSTSPHHCHQAYPLAGASATDDTANSIFGYAGIAGNHTTFGMFAQCSTEECPTDMPKLVTEGAYVNVDFVKFGSLSGEAGQQVAWSSDGDSFVNAESTQAGLFTCPVTPPLN